jgi:hypothetical protein
MHGLLYSPAWAKSTWPEQFEYILVVDVNAGIDEYFDCLGDLLGGRDGLSAGPGTGPTDLGARACLQMSHDGRVMVFWDTPAFSYKWAMAHQTAASAADLQLMSVAQMPRDRRIAWSSPTVFYEMSDSHSIMVMLLDHADVYAPGFPSIRVKRDQLLAVEVPYFPQLLNFWQKSPDVTVEYIYHADDAPSGEILPANKPDSSSFDPDVGPFVLLGSIEGEQYCREFADVLDSALRHKGAGRRFIWKIDDETEWAPCRRAWEHVELIQQLNLPAEVGGLPDMTTQLPASELLDNLNASSHLVVLAFCLIDGSVEMLIFEGADE